MWRTRLPPVIEGARMSFPASTGYAPEPHGQSARAVTAGETALTNLRIGSLQFCECVVLATTREGYNPQTEVPWQAPALWVVCFVLVGILLYGSSHDTPERRGPRHMRVGRDWEVRAQPIGFRGVSANRPTSLTLEVQPSAVLVSSAVTGSVLRANQHGDGLPRLHIKSRSPSRSFK